MFSVIPILIIDHHYQNDAPLPGKWRRTGCWQPVQNVDGRRQESHLCRIILQVATASRTTIMSSNIMTFLTLSQISCKTTRQNVLSTRITCFGAQALVTSYCILSLHKARACLQLDWVAAEKEGFVCQENLSTCNYSWRTVLSFRLLLSLRCVLDNRLTLFNSGYAFIFLTSESIICRKLPYKYIYHAWETIND